MTDRREVNESYALLAEVIRRSPSDSFQTIATRCSVALSTVSRVAKLYGLSRNNGITIDPEILNGGETNQAVSVNSDASSEEN